MIENDFLKLEMEKVEKALHKALRTRNKTVEKALVQLLDSGGKRLRPAFVILGATFGTYQSSAIVPVAAAVEIIHMATLIHDDIIDDAKQRRGDMTLQATLGKDIAVYSGDFLFTRAFLLVADLAEPVFLRDVAKGASYVCDSEIAQNEQKYDRNVTMKQYLKRIGGKTAALFALSLASGAYKADCPDRLAKKLGTIGKHIGMAFQIVDDILDFTGDQNTVGKPLLADTQQGVYTMPIIYALNSTYKAQMHIALDRIQEDQGRMLQEILIKSKAIEKSKAIAVRYIDKARKSTESLPEGIGRTYILDLINQQLERKY